MTILYIVNLKLGISYRTPKHYINVILFLFIFWRSIGRRIRHFAGNKYIICVYIRYICIAANVTGKSCENYVRVRCDPQGRTSEIH